MTADVLRWLAGHKRFTFHFTPTAASWKQDKTEFSILSRQAIHGSFENVRALTAAIERCTPEWNMDATPFDGVETVDEVLAKAVRVAQADLSTGH